MWIHLYWGRKERAKQQALLHRAWSWLTQIHLISTVIWLWKWNKSHSSSHTRTDEQILYLRLRLLFGALLWTQLNLIWHWNSLACPHVFPSSLWRTGQQASEDWQLSQAGVYWPACWWLGLHTIADTKPLFSSSQTPQLRADAPCSQRLSMWTPYLRSLCVDKAKAHYQDSRTQVAFWSFGGYSNYPWAVDLCVLDFPFGSDVLRDSATVPDKTRGDCCTCLWWRPWCIWWPLFLCYFCLYRQCSRWPQVV